MYVGYGGNQRRMIPSKIVSENYLGNGERILQVGDTQHFQFEESSEGPFDLKDAHLLKETREEQIMINGIITLRRIEGWLGKSKGMKQILWERGLWNPRMKKNESESEKEKKRLEGKALLPEELDMVQCHPELAGNDIEYAWGFSSSIFRRSNSVNGQNLEEKVEAARTIERIWKFERKARDYMSM